MILDWRIKVNKALIEKKNKKQKTKKLRTTSSILKTSPDEKNRPNDLRHDIKHISSSETPSSEVLKHSSHPMLRQTEASHSCKEEQTMLWPFIPTNDCSDQWRKYMTCMTCSNKKKNSYLSCLITKIIAGCKSLLVVFRNSSCVSLSATYSWSFFYFTSLPVHHNKHVSLKLDLFLS